jgi:TolB-like protein
VTVPRLKFLAIFFSALNLYAAEPRTETVVQKTGKRTVAIYPFINTRSAKNFAYLEDTLSEAILGELGKLKMFEFSAPNEIQASKKTLGKDYESILHEDVAAETGRNMHSDVVVTGNFMEIGGTMLVQAKAIDVASGRSKVTKSSTIKTDATMFDGIQKLAIEMSGDMAKALGPLEGRADFFQGTTIAFGSGASIPAGTFSTFYGTGWLLTGSATYPIIDTTIFKQPVSFQALLGFTYSQLTGHDTYLQTLRQTGLVGGLQMASPFFFKNLQFFVNAAFGYSYSILSRDFDGKEFSSLDPYLRTGLGGQWYFTPTIFAQAGSYFGQVFFTGPSQLAITGEVAIGYKIP